MTPAEFKAWFDGFTEALNGTPTKAQWSRIKERVAEIDGKPVTERHFVDHYWPRYQASPVITTAGWSTMCGNQSTTLLALGQAAETSNFENVVAMNILGRADAAAISA